MLEKTGIPTKDQIDNAFPSIMRLEKGPVAVIECYQHIPCNPCHTACKFGGIQAFEDLNDYPVINFENCNGCSFCVSNCPGLAIMVIDYTYSDKEALMSFPYELSPLPQKGDIAMALDRGGNDVKKVEVFKVNSAKILNKTAQVTIVVDKEDIKIIRNFRLL